MLTLAKKKTELSKEKKHGKTPYKLKPIKRVTVFARCPRSGEGVCHCKDRK